MRVSHTQGNHAAHTAMMQALQGSRPTRAPAAQQAPAPPKDADGDHDGGMGKNVDARA